MDDLNPFSPPPGDTNFLSVPEDRVDSILINNALGTGTPRDKMSGTFVNSSAFATRLSLEERCRLFAGDSFIRRLCSVVPLKAATRGWYCKIKDDGDNKLGDEVEEYRRSIAANSDTDPAVDGRRFTSLEDLFRIAQTYANYQDGCLLILNVDDGQPPEKPIDPKKIRRIAGIEVVTRRYCRPYLETAANILDPTHYEIISLRRGAGSPLGEKDDRLRDLTGKSLAQRGGIKIHCSRVIRFDGGDPLDEEFIVSNDGWYGNQIDLIWDYFKAWRTGLDAVGSTLGDSSLFVYKLKGLRGLVSNGKQGLISKRLNSLVQNASMLGGVGLDMEDEAIDYANRQQNGVADLLEAFKGVMVGATGQPHTVVLGESPSGLGASGDSEQQQLQELVSEQQRFWKAGLERIYRIMFLCKEGPGNGRIPDDWDVLFNPLREQNEAERIQNLSAFVNVQATAIGSGFLTAEEARSSFEGEADFNFRLDPKAWKEQKEKEEAQMGMGGGDFGMGGGLPPEELPPEELPTEEEIPAEEVPEEEIQQDSRMDSIGPVQWVPIIEVPDYRSEAWKAATDRFLVLDSAYAQDYIEKTAIEMERLDRAIADRNGLVKKKIRGKDGVSRTYWVRKEEMGSLEAPRRKYFGRKSYITGGGGKHITGSNDDQEKILAIGLGTALGAGAIGLAAWSTLRKREQEEFDLRRGAEIPNAYAPPSRPARGGGSTQAPAAPPPKPPKSPKPPASPSGAPPAQSSPTQAPAAPPAQSSPTQAPAAPPPTSPPTAPPQSPPRPTTSPPSPPKTGPTQAAPPAPPAPPTPAPAPKASPAQAAPPTPAPVTPPASSPPPKVGPTQSVPPTPPGTKSPPPQAAPLDVSAPTRIGKLSALGLEELAETESEVRNGEMAYAMIDGTTWSERVQDDSDPTSKDIERDAPDTENLVIVMREPDTGGAVETSLPFMIDKVKKGDLETAFLSVVGPDYSYRLAIGGEEFVRASKDGTLHKASEKADRIVEKWARDQGLPDPQAIPTGRTAEGRAIMDLYYGEIAKRVPGFEYESTWGSTPPTTPPPGPATPPPPASPGAGPTQPTPVPSPAPEPKPSSTQATLATPPAKTPSDYSAWDPVPPVAPTPPPVIPTPVPSPAPVPPTPTRPWIPVAPKTSPIVSPKGLERVAPRMNKIQDSLAAAARGETDLATQDPWAQRLGLVTPGGGLTPEGEIVHSHDESLRGNKVTRQVLAARLVARDDEIGTDSKTLHRVWDSLGGGSGDSPVDTLAAAIASDGNMDRKTAKRRAMRVLDAHAEIGFGEIQIGQEKGKKTYSVQPVKDEDTEDFLLYELALKREIKGRSLDTGVQISEAAPFTFGKPLSHDRFTRAEAEGLVGLDLTDPASLVFYNKSRRYQDRTSVSLLDGIYETAKRR